MKVGLIDVDSHNYPNLPLMKLSAWHKQQGDLVEWYDILSGHQDIVYMSKVFGFTDDYEYEINADKVIKGGTGCCIGVKDGHEFYDKSKDIWLPNEIEHIMPDYSLYGIEDKAYGFLTRGCPRGYDFCHVKAKEGQMSYKVANLDEFWSGQKYIVLNDPNILACPDWKDLLQQLIDSKADIDINQGMDIRMMTEEKAEMIKRMKIKCIHFAWDRYEDKDTILPKFEMFKDIYGGYHQKLIVYVLCNFNTTFEQDLERIYTLRDLGYWAYVMLYNKQSIPRGSPYNKLARWVNNRWCFAACERFEDYVDDYERKHKHD